MEQGKLGINTRLAHFGEEEKIKGAVVPPIFQNSLFLFDHIADLGAAMHETPDGPPYVYSRSSNPTVQLAEHKLANLEGAETCKLVGSGMGAITLAIMSQVGAGSHIVAIDTLYGPCKGLFTDVLARYGVTWTYVDGRCPDEIIDAIRPETSLVYLESPSSLLFRLQDVEAITRVTKERGIATAFDNTYNTPLHYNPIEHGVDIVVHSASKFLGGHSDLNAGAICTDAKRMDHILRHELNYFGSILHPFSAWLLLRGMRTLGVRLKHHEESANAVASWLDDRPEIDVVHHVSLPVFGQRELYRRMLGRSTSLFSFEPKNQDGQKIQAFCDRLKLFGRGVSWGGFESLVVAMPVQALGMPAPRWIVRLHIGLEEPADLIADLTQALGELG